MNLPKPEQFVEFYKAIHGYDPFPWQQRLAARVGEGSWPLAIALPTAAGKTNCIDIAVFALACRVQNAARRIFFVVDRRIVVDQAYLHAQKLAHALEKADSGILRVVADSLKALANEADSPDARPLDVYALRGGMYRESAWTRSPLQPTVVTSTVDQVGSRLLFRGYGVSDSMKPIHAALVGNDALILLDEAHCAKPFDDTMQAVKCYRDWTPSKTPFTFVSITATPTRADDVMSDDDADRQHAVLGKRILASKPTTFDVAEKAKGKNASTELMKVLEKQARELAQEFACVGIIVNRVRTARELKTKLGDDAVLLTGRMRPLDRDRILQEKLQPLLSNATGDLPKFVIGTQCLECGADFDLHALVTECASLDALRQRFGRLNRVANRTTAKAVIVIRGDQVNDSEDDPVYGASLGETWKWLNAKATDGVFDFGIAAVRAAIDGVDLTSLNAPTTAAPVLFPAHLDCWVQTHPIPTPDPDPALFLHGPKRTGQPDVQVVFRSDLGDDTKLWADVVTLCPPSSAEALAVPISVFKKWLAGEEVKDDSSDCEGEMHDFDDDQDDAEPSVRNALHWRGADNSSVIDSTGRVYANQVYVVPCNAAVVQSLGDFIDAEPVDYAEEAFARSRDRAFLRLDIEWLDGETDEERNERIQAAIQARSLGDANPPWLQHAITQLSKGHKHRIDERHPVRGVTVTSKRRLFQFDPEFLDDADSSYSISQSSVTLECHSVGVAKQAERFARGCGLDAELFYKAGLWHDLGKLDPRFQAMLKQSSPRTAVGIPWAKSAKSPRNPADREAARAVHRYPKGARHELLSVAMLEQQTSDDLLLHLVATHHGSARPFANAVIENDAARTPFVPELFNVRFELDSSRQAIEQWNATLPERFWRMVRTHGWWGSAYQEAILRLADHAQSRAEQEPDALTTVKPTPAPAFTPPTKPKPLYPLPLPGLDGSNPLAFLAALGTLRLAERAFPGTKLSWVRSIGWSAVLHLPEEVSVDAFIEQILEVASPGRRYLTFSKDLKIQAGEFEQFQVEAAGYARDDREFADFLTAFANPLITVQGGPNEGKTKPTEFYFIAGQQKFLNLAVDIATQTRAEHIRKCLFEQWIYDDPLKGLSLRWDPLDDLRHATRFYKPSEDKSKNVRGSVLGANRLAFEAMPFFPCFPEEKRLVTTAFTVLNRMPNFTWPIWTAAWGVDTVRSVLSQVSSTDRKSSRVILPLLGIKTWYQCEKVPNSDYSNFTPSKAL